MRAVFFSLLLFICGTGYSQVKILFDDTKAEQAGNADWVISNTTSPVQVPTPSQSAITASTAETYWNGGISSWGIDCVKQGYYVETLIPGKSITYGSTTNTQDLSKYSVYVVCEPNTQFTAAEKTAIINFVKNGGGLFMVSDHDNSDRNNDGWDSPAIWNDLMSTNSVQANPFGITFDLTTFSQTTSNVASLSNDSILHGSMGNVTKAMWSSGTSMTLDKTKNSTVIGQVFKTGSSNTGTTGVMFATAKYGNGKVAAIGDSSPCDDGTGNSGDTLYDGYWTDASGNHRLLLMNATIWLATHNNATPVENIEIPEITFYPNPVKNGNLYITAGSIFNNVQIFDVSGKLIKNINTNSDKETIDLTGISSGFYLCKISFGSVSTKKK